MGGEDRLQSFVAQSDIRRLVIKVAADLPLQRSCVVVRRIIHSGTRRFFFPFFDNNVGNGAKRDNERSRSERRLEGGRRILPSPSIFSPCLFFTSHFRTRRWLVIGTWGSSLIRHCRKVTKRQLRAAIRVTRLHLQPDGNSHEAQ